MNRLAGVALAAPMDGAVLQALLADTAAAAPAPAPTLTSGNTLVLWADAQVPPAVLARLAQHKLVSIVSARTPAASHSVPVPASPHGLACRLQELHDM